MGERESAGERRIESGIVTRESPFALYGKGLAGFFSVLFFFFFDEAACLGLSFDLCIHRGNVYFVFLRKCKVILGALGASVSRSLTLERTACINML